MSTLIPLPKSLVPFLEPYLPSLKNDKSTIDDLPFITLTYAQSLDSKIALTRGVQTKISHLETKTMTHYIRSRHDAILIGISTLLIDNPSLSCRFSLDGSKTHKIRPVIIDPGFKCFESYESLKVNQMFKEDQIAKPLIVINSDLLGPDEEIKLGNTDNYDVIAVKQSKSNGLLSISMESDRFLDWNDIFKALKKYGISSVMVEGGAKIINDLLVTKSSNGSSIIDSLIVTVAPKFLGNKGVDVSPCQEVVLANEDDNESNVSWWVGKQDSVLAVDVHKKV